MRTTTTSAGSRHCRRPGQAILVVATAGGRVVLAADAMHDYEELDRDRPFSVVADLPAMYAAFDLIREMAQDAGTSIVAGHDPLVMERPARDPPQAELMGSPAVLRNLIESGRRVHSSARPCHLGLVA